MKIERQLAWPCHDCKVRGMGFCSTLIDGTLSSQRTEQNHIAQIFLDVEKNEVIHRDDGKIPFEPFVLCQGWAYTYCQLPGGQRQILSVLIPGDPLSAFAVLGSRPGHSVRAATDAKLCQFRRDDIWKEIASIPRVYDAFGELCAAEIDDTISASINLAKRNPVSRFVGFVHRIVGRLLSRGIVIDTGIYQFPLSYADIADATGLTPEDVDRAVVALREDGIIDLTDERLTILDRAAFERNAVEPAVRPARRVIRDYERTRPARFSV